MVIDGVEALLLAPTALNKQAFTVRGDGNKVYLTCDSGHFAGIDLGIGKYHFEVGAGKDNFEWAKNIYSIPLLQFRLSPKVTKKP